MKTRMVVLAVALLLIPGAAWAGPFLVCNPYSAADGVTNFKVTMDSAAPADSAPVSNSLHYDLSTVSNGAHTVMVQACNVWGCSASSSPFGFTKSVPGGPTGIVISNQ